MSNEMISNIKKNDYKIISNEEALKLMATFYTLGKYEPLGKFLIDKNEKDVYVAIDNEDGEAWTEEFSTKEKAIAWLHGTELEDSEEVKQFSISIEETLRKEVKVYATSEEEALDKIKEMYANEEIVLDSSDFVEYNLYW